MSMRAVIALALSAALSGCMLLGPNYQRPTFKLPRFFGGSDEKVASAAPAPLSVPADWWRLYQDRTLDELVTAGLKNNADIRRAVARVEEVEAVLREANTTFLPEIDANVNASRAQSSTRTGTLPPNTPAIRNNILLSATTSFEVDFWGRLRRIRESARADYVGSTYARDVVGLTIAASIAQTYFSVRSIDAQIALSEETLKASAESVELTRRRERAGVVSGLDVSQAEANRAQLAAQIKDLRRQRAVAVHQLGVLSGVLDVSIPTADLRDLPSPPLPPPGLPSELLERRPDVRQAEQTLAAATAQIGVARAAQFPTLSITGQLGVQSRELSTLFSPGATIWSIGAGALGPVLDWGRFAARTQQAEARARQAEAAYEKTAQTAFREVSDALSNVRLAADTEQDLRDRVEQARNIFRLSTLRYDSGYSAYLEVLDAQRTLNDAQLALVRNRQAFLNYTVDLMNALGGGWQAPAAAGATSKARAD
jgi:multidrug efflux system outer membrane protein